MIYLRIAAALAIAGLLWGAVHVWNKASRVDVAEAALTDYKAAVAVREKQEAKDRDADDQRRVALSATLGDISKKLDDLNSKPVTPVVYREKPAKDGKCDDPRIGPDWLRVYNEAADASTVHSAP